jgi:hypothetical protein
VTHFQPFDPTIRRTEAVFVEKETNIIRKAMKGQVRVLLEFCDKKVVKKREKWIKIASDFGARFIAKKNQNQQCHFCYIHYHYIMTELDHRF